MLSFFDHNAQRLRIEQRINDGLRNVQHHGKFILGPEVARLEKELIAFTGAKSCITCANGTDALHIALLAAGIGPGDEVIVPAFTYIAPIEVIALIGATPVFVDVDYDDCTILVDAIEEKITNKTKAVIAVSLYGQPANFSELSVLGEKHGLIIIEDAAQSFGAEQLGKKSCNLSMIACTSFFPTKPLGCYGDGGAIFTSNDEIAERARQIARHGQDGKYNHVSVGMNSRLDTIQAMILLAKLEILESEIKLRHDKAKYFFNMLKSYDDGGLFKLPVIRKPNTSAWAQYTLIICNRDLVLNNLARAAIPFAIHYPKPIFQQRAYLQKVNDCLNSVELCQKVVSMPINAYTETNEIDYLCEILSDCTK